MENETRTVQSYRHAARASLTEARESLSLRTPETKEVYHLLNGHISSVLAGRVGFTKDEQVAHLAEAQEKVEAGMASLTEKIAAAKASILEQVEGWEQNIRAKAQEAADTLAEAKEYAATRDFDAHQASKGRGTSHVEYDEYDEEEGDEF